MKTIITKGSSDSFKMLIGVLIVWGGLAMVYSPIILPGPIVTIKAMVVIFMDAEFLVDVFITLKRLSIGLMGAIVLGSVLGIIIGSNKKARDLFNPLFHIIQATPPISWLVLAIASLIFPGLLIAFGILLVVYAAVFILGSVLGGGPV